MERVGWALLEGMGGEFVDSWVVVLLILVALCLVLDVLGWVLDGVGFGPLIHLGVFRCGVG